MPLKKKKNIKVSKVLLWVIIIALIVLMIISFEPTQHLTEVALTPTP